MFVHKKPTKMLVKTLENLKSKKKKSSQKNEV